LQKRGFSSVELPMGKAPRFPLFDAFVTPTLPRKGNHE
jgi:hypothetical protein